MTEVVGYGALALIFCLFIAWWILKQDHDDEQD